MARRTFHVDLRGVVDLLSHHLYSSPRVYVRELLQNAVDAVTARGLPVAEGRIVFEPAPAGGDGILKVHDNGIGLTEPQVHELLATIGRSSKRDELGFARHEFLGQFGIGLLSCFMVADEIEVLTQGPGETSAVRWRGHADGHYTVEPAPARDAGQGTTVALSPRPGAEHWLDARVVAELVRDFGSLLPYDIRIDDTPATESALPWAAPYPDPGMRRTALLRYAERVMELRPFDVIDLAVPEAGLTGLAFVLPAEAHPSERAAHRVYVKRMLVGDRVERLLPDWAFFVRCVVDAGELRPTASREQLYDDELLGDVRKALGDRLRDWLRRLAATDPQQLQDFLRLHSRGVEALALHDDAMLQLVYHWVHFETSDGQLTLQQFRRRYGPRIRYTASVEDFRQLAGVASAQGLGLVNGGYANGSDLLHRLVRLDPEIEAHRLEAGELVTRFEAPEPAADAAVEAFLLLVRPVLDRLSCQPVVRAYDPPEVPVLHLDGTEARAYAEGRAARDEAEGAWAGLLDAAPYAPALPLLVLNHRNPLVRRLVEVTDPAVAALAVEALYGQALLAGQRPLRPGDLALLNRSFLGLLERAL